MEGNLDIQCDAALISFFFTYHLGSFQQRCISSVGNTDSDCDLPSGSYIVGSWCMGGTEFSVEWSVGKSPESS